MKATPDENGVYEFVVIGAGIAGLGAATYLQGQGKHVLVLESEVHPGGRMWTNRKGKVPHDTAAQFIDSSYKNIMRYSKRYGLVPKKVVIPRMGIAGNGEIHLFHPSPKGLAGYKGLNKRTRLGFLGSMAPLILGRPRIDIYNLRTGLSLDNITAAKYLAARSNKRAVAEFLDPLIHGLTFYTLKDISAAFIKAFMSKLLFLKPLTYHKGIGELSDTLAKQLDIRYNTRVQAIERQVKAVSIRTEDGTVYKAQKVIVALPGNRVLPLLKRPTAAERIFFPCVQYTSAVVVHCRAKAFMKPHKYAVFFKPKKGAPLAAIHHNPYSPGGKFDYFIVTLSSYYAGQYFAGKVKDLDIQKAVQETVGELEEFTILDRTSWPSAVSKYQPGYLKKLYRFIDNSKADKQLFYAGDYIGGGYTEMAFTSGLDAAKQALER